MRHKIRAYAGSKITIPETAAPGDRIIVRVVEQPEPHKPYGPRNMSLNELVGFLLGESRSIPRPDGEIYEKLLGDDPMALRCMISHYAKDADKYGSVKHEGKEWGAHVLVHRAYKIELEGRDLEPGEMVRHLCGRRGCINPYHLTSGTAKDNSRDMLLHGTVGIIKEPDIPIIVRLYQVGWKQSEIAEKFGVTPKTISAIVTGKTHKHVKRQIVKDRHIRLRGLPRKAINRMRRLYLDGCTMNKLADEYQIPWDSVRKVVLNLYKSDPAYVVPNTQVRKGMHQKRSK